MFTIFYLPVGHGRINPELLVRANDLVQHRPAATKSLWRVEHELYEQGSVRVVDWQGVAPSQLGVPSGVLADRRLKPVLQGLLALLCSFHCR